MHLAQIQPFRILTDFFNESRLFNEFLAFTHQNWLDAKRIRAVSHPRSVLFIPGFLASDLSLKPLANCLAAVGHKVSFGGIWCNADCPRATLERLEKVLRKLNAADGKVTIVGHSLGGIYARELAKRHPEMVERVFLLGSPLKDAWSNSSLAVKFLALGAVAVHGRRQGCSAFSLKLCGIEPEGKAPDVPETIIYSKTDGVVHWESCIERGPEVETIEVQSSHCGMACSTQVLKILLDRISEEPHRIAARIALVASNPAPVKRDRREVVPQLRVVARARVSAA